MTQTWIVTGNCRGRRLVEELQAGSQSEARAKYERLNPDYRAGSARRA